MTTQPQKHSNVEQEGGRRVQQQIVHMKKIWRDDQKLKKFRTFEFIQL